MNAVSFLYFVADEVASQVHAGGSKGDALAEGIVSSLVRAMQKCANEPDVQVSRTALRLPTPRVHKHACPLYWHRLTPSWRCTVDEQAQGISLLHSMCVDSPRRVLATRLGAAGVALGALQTVMESPEVQSDALSVLKALTGDDQCVPYIGSVEGAENIGKVRTGVLGHERLGASADGIGGGAVTIATLMRCAASVLPTQMMDVIAELRGNVGSKRHGQAVLDLAVVSSLVQDGS